MKKTALNKIYNSQQYEDEIYRRWEESGFFNPDNLQLPPTAPIYTIILPPPNITDKLHLGHASMLAIQDLFIRYKRMRGFRTLWLPGTDHAAIATQTVVEKNLKKAENKTRHDLGREAFLERVWDFLSETQATILKQTKKMGASLDWSRLAFTLDDKRQTAVKEMFIQMHEEGLIYRGERIVNWCPRCCSTLADDEVEYKKQKTKLYAFRYDKKFPIVIATTRPETKLGDTAVAVNPTDERYKKFIDQVLEADFCGFALRLPVIGDRNVDKEFGTGALGVTPAHSAVDWQMAEKNNLPIIKVINEQGLIREEFGEFSGLQAEAARDLLVEKLETNGLLEGVEEIDNNLSVCYRCGTAIEPLPSKQWFVAVDKPIARLGNKSLKQAALMAAEKMEFIPARFSKRYEGWLENLRDWCISRQIWFGHSLPVWYCENNLTQRSNNKQGNKCAEPIVTRDIIDCCSHCGGRVKQEADTLDTWFSSGMWTFSTLGWPDNFQNKQKISDLAKFHPTQLMETGYDIITLWVSRMVMMSLFAVGEIPFEKVYLHGTVLDKQGKKMSKSKGNGIDPVAMSDLYGADAVRLALLVGNTPGVDFRLSEEKISAYRNFTNKFWNIARFIAADLEAGAQNHEAVLVRQNFSLADRWILEKLNALIIDVGDLLDAYNFSLAGERLEKFTWNDLADWYLEISKIEGGKNEILLYILNNLLRLWHPFVPFITEVLWRELFSRESMLMMANWPKPQEGFEGGDLEVVKNLIIGIRAARSANRLEPSQKIKAVVYAGDQTQLLMDQSELIKNLRTGISDLLIQDKGESLPEAIYFTDSGVEVYLIAVIDQAQEKARLEKDFVNLEKFITNLEARLDNQDFQAKAPAAIIKQEMEKLAQAKAALEKIKERLS